MSVHTATIAWRRDTASFEYENYSRDHTWTFGALVVPASAAPDFLGSVANVDPEQAFVAALSSCHMLTFLAIAARRRLVVDRYVDEAEGILEKNTAGKLVMTRVILRPVVTFSAGTDTGPETLARLHHRSHEECFIANSVHTEVIVEAGAAEP